MKIVSIQTDGFRNLKPSKIDFTENLNCFIGENGQGKSNYLEAVSYIFSGSSFRKAKIEHMFNFESCSKNFTIEAQFIENKVLNNIRVKCRESKPEFYLNEKKISRSSIKKKVASVVFSPQSLSAIQQGPESRRKLVDLVVENSGDKAYRIVKNFEKTLKTKNSLLRILRKQEGIYEENLKTLESLNQLMCLHAQELTRARKHILLQLMPGYQEFLEKTWGKKISLNIQYIEPEFSHHEFDFNIESGLKKDSKLNLMQAISDKKQLEILAGTSLVGPHKHDIRIEINGQDSRFYCSQGQQRLLVLGFLTAEAQWRVERGQQVLLIMDDLMSELDSVKQNALYEFIKNWRGPCFMSTVLTENKLTHLLKEKVQFFEVSTGSIEPYKSSEA